MKKINFDDIREAVAQFHDITSEELDPVNRGRANGAARMACVFLAARAGFSNQEIQTELNYKTIEHVSNIFNKAQGQYELAQTDFFIHAGRIAKELKLKL